LLRRSDKGGNGVASAVLKVGEQEMNLFSNPGIASSPTTDDPPGLDHFEVESATIDELLATLAQAGVAVAKGPVRRRDGISLFVSDPDGCRVELIVKK
jgi:catechol 2,3-dioxygenase-like lactoylglutathione lyase family enzyme